MNDTNSVIKKKDGTLPFNGYLWPDEDWWMYNEPEFKNYSADYHFGIIHLSDGRFSIEGMVCEIEKNSTDPFNWHKGSGRPVVFNDRNKAIRIAAARMIQRARWARDWHDIKNKQLSEINNWALKIVSRETSRKDFKPIHLQDSKLIKPVVNTCGLDLFDFQKEASA